MQNKVLLLGATEKESGRKSGWGDVSGMGCLPESDTLVQPLPHPLTKRWWSMLRKHLLRMDLDSIMRVK